MTRALQESGKGKPPRDHLGTGHAPPSTKQILRQVKSLEQHLNNLEMIPAIHLYRNTVVLALLSKALTVCRAICVLIDAGFHSEAFGLSRTLIEIFFCMRYISNKDTETRAETYVNYSARVRLEWKNVILKHFPQTPPHVLNLDAEVLERAKGFKNRAHWTGHGGQAKLMALEEDTVEVDEQGLPFKSEFDYDALYFWTSQFVHATVDGITGHAGTRGEVFKVRARMHVEKRLGRLSIFNMLVFLCKTFVHACRAMNEEQPRALLRMYKMIAKCGMKGP
jgi:Family of unknown function (DUF5677)